MHEGAACWINLMNKQGRLRLSKRVLGVLALRAGKAEVSC